MPILGVIYAGSLLLFGMEMSHVIGGCLHNLSVTCWRHELGVAYIFRVTSTGSLLEFRLSLFCRFCISETHLWEWIVLAVC